MRVLPRQTAPVREAYTDAVVDVSWDCAAGRKKKEAAENGK
jgi:hypothetical protein